jgi:hypothetical protein
MGAVKNILKTVVVEVEEFLHWMIDKLEDNEARNEILKTFGLPTQPNAPAIPQSSLQSINAYTKLDDETIKIEAFASVVMDIINVTNAIEDFANVVSHDDSEVATEFIDLMLQLYTMDYARLRSDKHNDEKNKSASTPYIVYRTFYNIIKLVDFYYELASASGDLFSIGRISKFFKLGVKAFNADNKEWALLLNDWKSLSQQQYDIIRNQLPEPQKTQFEASKFDFTDGTNHSFLVPVSLLPYKFKTAGKSLTAGEWDFVWEHIPAVERNEYSEKQIKSATDWLLLIPSVLPWINIFSGFRSRINYGFDPSPLSTSPVADRMTERAITLSFKVKHTDNTDIETESTLFLSAAIQPNWEGGVGVKLRVDGDLKLEKKFDNNWVISIETEGLPSENSSVKMKLKYNEEQDRHSLGDSTGTRLEIGSISFSLEGSVEENELDFKIAAKDCAFVIAKGKSDSFIAKLLPDKGISGNFDIGIGYSVKKQLYIDGGSGLSVLIPVHASVSDSKNNNLILNSFFLQGKNNDDNTAATLETSIGFTASLLGISATVERIGLMQNFTFKDAKTNLSAFHYDIDFKPPNGIGLSIDRCGLKGGGYLYLDFEKGEYVGALELKFGDRIDLKAIGIINTKIPGIDYSFLIIITTEFDPPFHTPMGFALKGVGGLIGINRMAKINVLREGIKTNSLKSVLFPDNVIANISRIVSDIKQIFPPTDSYSVYGLMAEIEWGKGSLLTLEVGFLLQVPNPQIIILGVLSAIAPQKETALVKIQINFLGVIDYENKYISFDASLYDSKFLVYTLTGDAAFRLSWGDPFIFIFTVGGFHPAFHDAPGDLQKMTRLTVSLNSGENPRVTLQAYFAITSNTFQHGAKAELYASSGSFNIYGFIGYDLLIHVANNSLSFVADFSAGIALRHDTSVLMSIGVSGELAGVSPLSIHGEASISFFFFSISIPFSYSIGDPAGTSEVQQADILSLLTNEVNDTKNWKAQIPGDNTLHVSVKKMQLDSDTAIVIHPFGILTFSQNLVPLGLDIEKFDNQLPKDAKHFDVKTTDSNLITEDVNEEFAPAIYFELTDEEKLARPSFEKMKSGFKISSSAALQAPSKVVSKPVEYELTYLGRKKRGGKNRFTYLYTNSIFRENTKGSAVSRSTLSYLNNRVSLNAPEGVDIQAEQYAIANISDMKLHSNELVANSYTEALQFYNGLIKKQPGLKNQVQVVSQYELNRN